MKKFLAILLPTLFSATQLFAQWHTVGGVDSVRTGEATSVHLFAGNTVTAVSVIADDCIRVRFVPGRRALPPDYSWAITGSALSAPSVRIRETAGEVLLQTAELTVAVTKNPLRIIVSDQKGNVVVNDHPGKGMAWSGHEVRVWKSSPPGERFYGFGEKAGTLERRGTSMTMWNSDIPAYGPDTDPLYQSVPFFYAVDGGRAYGIFFDNPHWSSFDMAKGSRDQYSFGAEGGELDYYFFFGPSPGKILRRFTELVGRMPLPPRWALGYQQCRWSYTPESRVREIAARFRSEKIPCDVIYLDIDYMDGYRVFTWNQKSFPSPTTLISDLARDGFKVVTIIDPGIKVDTGYAVYRSGAAGNHFVLRPTGGIFTGNVWPGLCAFPDFANASARRWWGDQFAPLVAAGVSGWWTDMNEPSVFNVPTKTIDLNAIHKPDGGPPAHGAVHNVYGLEMTRATYDGVTRLLPDRRPFLLTRASYAGGHRYAAAWTGDNIASWEHLRMALTMCLNMSVSGQPFVGSDIGGFFGYPTGELFVRWLQLGAFTPLMRAHSHINERDKEPWAFGEPYTSINRETINLRYRLLPYLYAAMEEASRTGIPPMRPLAFEDSVGEKGWDHTEFLFGRDLLVAPVLEPGARSRTVYLPPGDWYEFWSGARMQGGTTRDVQTPLDRIPLFARAGSVIPTQPVLQHTGETNGATLELCVYPPEAGGSAGTELYEDDGTTFGYSRGEYLRRTVHVRQRSDSLTISITVAAGAYTLPPRQLMLRVVSLPRKPSIVSLNGVTLAFTSPDTSPILPATWTYDGARRETRIHTSDGQQGMTCIIRY